MKTSTAYVGLMFSCQEKSFLDIFLIDVINLIFSAEETCTVASSIPG